MRDLDEHATRAPQKLLEVRELSVHFPVTKGVIFRRDVGAIRAVDGVDVSIGRGESLGLVGESGSGKSTIGRAILGLYRPTSGSVVFDGSDLADLNNRAMSRVRRRIQMIFQDPYSSLDPRMKVGPIVSEPLDIFGIGSRRARTERVHELLRVVGLHASFADRYPHEFSGGQRQRIGIARALAVSPDLIVADEPVSSLDVSVQAQLINLLVRLRDELGLSYLFIAHDLAVVRQVADRVAVMYLGKIVEIGKWSKLYEEPLHPYTKALLSAVPVPDPKIEKRRNRIVLEGEIPSPASPPSGCSFHTRCWLRKQLGDPEVCVHVDPDLTSYAADHSASCHFI